MPLNSSHPHLADAGVAELLHRFLTALEPCRQVPLQFQIDCEPIVRDLLTSLGGGNDGTEDLVYTDPDRVVSALRRVANEAMMPSGEPQRHDASAPVAPTESADAVPTIARWLEAFHHRMRQIDSRALDVIRLRINGDTPRQVSEQLGLGLRLINRLLSEMRAAWKGGALP